MQSLSNFNDSIQLFNLSARDCEMQTRTMEFEPAKLPYRPHTHTYFLYERVRGRMCMSVCCSITSTINTLTHTGCGFTQRVCVCVYVMYLHTSACVFVCVCVCVAWLIKNVLRINIIALGIQLND